MERLGRLAVDHRQSIKAAAGVIVAAIILIPMGWHLYVQRAEVAIYLAGVNVKLLFAALGLAALDLGIFVLPWLLIANRLGIALGFARDLRAFFLSNFARRVPGLIWYVAGRAYLYRAESGGAWLATTGTVLENAFLLLTGLLLALTIWPQQLGLGGSWMLVAVLVSVSVVVAFSIRPTAILRVAWLLRRRKGALQIPDVRLSAVDVLLLVVLYALVWVVGGLSFHCFVAAFYPSLSLAALPLTISVSTAYSLAGFVAFFAPAGLGVKELTGAYLLSRTLPTPLAVTVVLLFRLNLLLAEGAWLGLSYLLKRRIDSAEPISAERGTPTR